MRILYFAWVREQVGRAEERLDRPDGVSTVGGLLDWLAGRDEGFGQALADRARIRVAVNQDYAGDDHAVAEDDEVAIFPPVTGG